MCILPPGLDLLDIGNLRVVLHRHEAETHSVKELDPVHPRDSHVEEDSKENGKRHKLQDRGEENGDSEEHRDGESSQPLVSNADNFRCFPRNVGR